MKQMGSGVQNKKSGVNKKIAQAQPKKTLSSTFSQKQFKNAHPVLDLLTPDSWLINKNS